MVAPKPQLVTWPRIKGIHSPHTTMGRVVAGSKWDHELQLCVVWQHEKLAILISPNLKPHPVCGERTLREPSPSKFCRAALPVHS